MRISNFLTQTLPTQYGMFLVSLGTQPLPQGSPLVRSNLAITKPGIFNCSTGGHVTHQWKKRSISGTVLAIAIQPSCGVHVIRLIPPTRKRAFVYQVLAIRYLVSSLTY